MADLTVYIGTSSNATYDRRPPVIRPEHTVEFVLTDGRTDAVTVDFGLTSPFPQLTVHLNGDNALTATQTRTVRSEAEIKRYSFVATSDSQQQGPGGQYDQPGTVSGELDVTTTPPTDPEDPPAGYR